MFSAVISGTSRSRPFGRACLGLRFEVARECSGDFQETNGLTRCLRVAGHCYDASGAAVFGIVFTALALSAGLTMGLIEGASAFTRQFAPRVNSPRYY